MNRPDIDSPTSRLESAGSLTLSGDPADCGRDSDGIKAQASRRRGLRRSPFRPQRAFESAAMSLPAIRPSHLSMTPRASAPGALGSLAEGHRLERHRRRRSTDPGGHSSAREAIAHTDGGAGRPVAPPTNERTSPMGIAALRAIADAHLSDADLWHENQIIRRRLDAALDRCSNAELRTRALASILRGWTDGRLECDPRACVDLAESIADFLAAACD